MTQRFVLTALLLCSTISAWAGEITLYEHANYAGRAITLRASTPDLVPMGFNDMTSSIVVRSGTWEVCMDAGFNGQCLILRRGEYPLLESNFNDQISSLREIEDVRSGDYRERGAIELFAQRDQRGFSVRLDRNVKNFERIDFNDRAMSAVVHEGVWILCTDARYTGTCRAYPPGRYDDLGPGMERTVSSAQLDRDDDR